MGSVAVSHFERHHCLRVTICFPRVASLPAIVMRVRSVFDLGADIATITSHLARDPLLAPLVTQRPGLRAPGGWDGFELAVRAILGQQVSVAAARQLAGRLVLVCGRRVPNGLTGHLGLTHAFPTAERMAAADLSSIGMPAARRTALKAIAEAAVSDPDLFCPFGTIEDAIKRLRTIRGVGEWTAQYIALRALREPDAFPASDAGLLRGAGAIDGVRPTPASLLRRAEPWRPWRAYAAQHLWTVGSDPISAARKEAHAGPS
jgi:AraC family transcriptional regulator of adaptative response / DNA-3-methyladenine glycosylase II